jgi:predicted Rossmann fold flavoprotein
MRGIEMSADTTRFDAIIIGAGAAGLMAAFTAGQRGRRVLLLDHADKPGKKILISGGGRCNFTNLGTSADRFLSANPHFARSALDRYTPADFVALVERHGIAWHEKTLGQLFCDGSARQIVAMLLGECEMGHVDIRCDHAVTSIDKPDDFRVATTQGTFTAPSLAIATGGPTIPKMGATGFAYDVARRFGLKVVEPRPALVPLTLGGDDEAFRALSGVSVDAVARCGRAAFAEAALFTHRGLSGPAVLQISSYWRHGDLIELDLLPGEDAAAALVAAKRARPRALLRTVLGERLPARLADTLSPAGYLADLPDKTLTALGAKLNHWPFVPTGSEGFAKAEVTIGGVDTAGLSQKTLEAKAVPGLFFVGEAVDVTGWLGGYNFQWAWASGWSAGQML